MTEINDLSSKSTPDATDEFEIQETSGGASKKATLSSLDATSLTGLLADDVTWTGDQDFQGGVTLTSTDAGATANPTLTLDRNSTSPVPNDGIGLIVFSGRNDAGTPETIDYARIRAEILDETDGTEDGELQFQTMENSGLVYQMKIANGVVVGGATGSYQGSGTLNATALYDDGVAVTDYVFDAFVDGEIDIKRYEDGREHIPARDFDLTELDPETFKEKCRNGRSLPAIDRMMSRNAGGKVALHEREQAMLETIEVMAVHIAKLEARIAALETP